MPTPTPGTTPGTALTPEGPTMLRTKARWTQASWRDLPGWESDRSSAWWPALAKGCAKPAPAWAKLCEEVRRLGADWGHRVGDGFVRQWVESHFEPWRVTALDGANSGLLTGYFEPLLEGRRKPDARFAYPLHRAPAGLGQRKPFFSRSELESTPEGRAAIAGREVVWLADPLDVLLIQVQGSGRIRLLDEPTSQGSPKVIRLAFAGHNEQPYMSVARWLVDQGAFTLEQASWPAIRSWAQANPARVGEMMAANPRVVFFREEALPDPEVGPNGAQGVALTPGRSIAVDRDSVPLGTPVWLDSTVPQSWVAGSMPPASPLRRLVMAQDTGGAILGAVRADFFWGWGDEALAQAGRTKQPLAMWVLWPVGP
ncbi:murein transglycosylase A [Aquabacterium commune]|nr:MltA domain-containing protein [Aquabacterium commune]